MRLSQKNVNLFTTLFFFCRYNVLLNAIKISLQELQKSIKGLVVMSADLEEIFTCVFEGRVPQQWLKGNI